MALREWYASRELLLTGVTSDVGTALIEKILRSFPDVTVYVVLRSQSGADKDDRIKQLFSTPRYERASVLLRDISHATRRNIFRVKPIRFRRHAFTHILISRAGDSFDRVPQVTAKSDPSSTR